MPNSRSLAEIEVDLVNLLKALYRANDDGERTRYRKETARLLVDARERLRTPAGDIDWRGQSYDYRQLVYRAFEAAAIPVSQRANLQASLRYHVTSHIRARLDEETLEAAGLSPKDQRTRHREKRQALAQRLELSPLNVPVIADFDTLRYTLLAIIKAGSKIDPAYIRSLSGEDRATIVADIKVIRDLWESSCLSTLLPSAE